jgi:hypothetical protein
VVLILSVSHSFSKRSILTVAPNIHRETSVWLAGFPVFVLILTLTIEAENFKWAVAICTPETASTSMPWPTKKLSEPLCNLYSLGLDKMLENWQCKGVRRLM